jgi:hypothetical protein
MASGDDIAGALGERLTTSAEPGGLSEADTAGQEISQFNSFIETFGQSNNQHGGGAQW